MSDENKTSQQPQVIQSVLPEVMRQQYLSAMGIQTWYDPTIELVPAEVSEPGEHRLTQDISQNTHEKSPSAAVEDVHKTDEDRSIAELAALHISIEQCQLCELHASRKQSVAGDGNTEARLMVITDAPVNDSNGKNVLFKEKEKQLLQAMLYAIELDLPAVYLTSLVKCQPPEQRAPYTSEIICCDDHLSTQINLIKPDVILILGEHATQQLLVSQKSIADLRLRQHQHLGVPVYASYHPADLLNSSENKSKVWQDLLQLKKLLA